MMVMSRIPQTIPQPSSIKLIAAALGLAIAPLVLTGCQAKTSVLAPSLGIAPQTLVVTGQGMVEIPRNTSRVSLGVQIQAATPEEVQQAIAEKSNAVVSLLKANGEVKKLETTGINLIPNYKSENGKQVISGYGGSNTVHFEIAPEKMGKILDEAIKAGATKIDGVTLVADDTALETAQQTAIARASENAQKQAEAALKALNLKPTKVLSIQINGAQAPMLNANTMDSALLKAPMAITAQAVSTPVIAGTQRVESTVTLQVQYQL